MAQTLDSMRRRIESAEDLYAVVRVMKALAAASIRQCEKTVESLAEYSRTIEAGLHVVLQNQPEDSTAAMSPTGGRCGYIVFGSDQGMCGSFNEQVATFALEEMGALSCQHEQFTVVVIGARVVGRLEDAGYQVAATFPVPATVSRIAAAVHEVLLKVEELRFQRGIDRVFLVHHRPTHPAGSRLDKVQVLPVDAGWLGSLASRSWPSRSLPMFTLDWRRLFSALIRQHLFGCLYRAFAESLASESASRLASMQVAEQNIQNHLSDLTAHFHRGRQQAITEELLDIVAGFETLTNEAGHAPPRLVKDGRMKGSQTSDSPEQSARLR